MASDNAETSGRANVQESVRNLAESTGGFLIGDSNDLRVPLRHVNEEISSYYEVSFNPGIQTYDGSFRKIAVNANRKDLVIHARNGYFALPPEASAGGLEPFEVPLLKAISDAKVSDEVKFRAGATLLQPRVEGTSVAILVEVPLHELQPKAGAATSMLDVHCSLAALVKDAKGEVVQKLTRDRGVSSDCRAVEDGELPGQDDGGAASGKVQPGKRRDGSRERQDRNAAFGVHGAGEGRGSGDLFAGTDALLHAQRQRTRPQRRVPVSGRQRHAYHGPDGEEGTECGAAPVLHGLSGRRNFGRPAVEMEFLQSGKVLTKVPMQLPAADAQGRIPYLMTIPAESIPSGSYEVRATARQAASVASSSTTIVIE